MRTMQTAPIPGETAPHFFEDPVLNEAVKAQILSRMRRREPPERIIALVEQNFHIEIDREQMLSCWNARNTPPTQTGPRQEKESMQISTEAGQDFCVPRMADGNPPAPITGFAPANLHTETDLEPVDAGENDSTTPPDQFGPETEKQSPESLPADAREYIIGRMARRDRPWMVAQDVERNFGLVVDCDEIIVCWRDRDAVSTQTGPRQEKESMPKLNDEIKEFIVKRIACYETPSRIAAAVRINFGVDIDRRQVFEYDPAGSRPPAQRWIDLHAATRARFLRDVAEIGVAQKAIRLRMLDRFAQMAEDNDRHDKAAKFLEQAARECGGFYEKQRTQASPSQESAGGSGPVP